MSFNALFQKTFAGIHLLRNKLAALPRPFLLLWRAGIVGFWLLYFAFVTAVLLLRHSVLPNIEVYHARIEAALTQQLHQNVRIGRIEAGWEGLNPNLSLYDVSIATPEGTSSLSLSRVDAALSWFSVWHQNVRLALLRIEQPTLHLRRDSTGIFSIAGFPFDPAQQEQGDNAFAEWLLAQRRIRIQHAKLIWNDELRQAPELILQNLDFALDNTGGRHRFGLIAEPPAELAAKLELRGDLKGNDLGQAASWPGQVFAEIQYADLAAWQRWFDYPLAVTKGRGALRTWLTVRNHEIVAATTDLAVQDTQVQFAKELPSLLLNNVSGRLIAARGNNTWLIEGRKLTLNASKEGKAEPLNLDNADFMLSLQPDGEGLQRSGQAMAKHLDLGVLAHLAACLPISAELRQMTQDYAPSGMLNELSAQWKKAPNSDEWQEYSAKAHFTGLALQSQNTFPGFAGLSGKAEISTREGKLNLQSQQALLDLPMVFTEQAIKLDQLGVDARWKIDKNRAVHVELHKAEFANADLAGAVKGSYTYTGQGAGTINLSGGLSRADARAVWRYIPRVAGSDVQHWLHRALQAGTAPEAKLTLRGNLDDFPFRDPKTGEFLITVKAEAVTLDYGDGWPKIDGIDGNLRFAGPGMLINAQRGNLMNAQISKAEVEIPDFDVPIPPLRIDGQVSGATADFLRFIEKSPVSAKIDHLTEAMRAKGNGHLNLKLEIPLHEEHLHQAKIDGTYTFSNNDIIIDAALPALKQATGSLHFTETQVQIPSIEAKFLSSPLKINGGSQKNGTVLIDAHGSLNLAHVSRDFPNLANAAVLTKMAGESAFQAKLFVDKKNVDLLIQSDLKGISSSLPVPLSKTSAETMALRLERKRLPNTSNASNSNNINNSSDSTVREQIELSLGSQIAGRLIVRKKANSAVNERGALVFGQPLVLPESGLLLAITAKSIDLDRWRSLLDNKTTSATVSSAPSPTLPVWMPDRIRLKTPDMNLLGRHYKDVDLALSFQDKTWKVELDSQQAAGSLSWQDEAQGSLRARLKYLHLDDTENTGAENANETLKKLPALDLVVNDFSLGKRRFGVLELKANNEQDRWRLSRIALSNPYGTLTGQGLWLTSGNTGTELDFVVDSDNTGKLLDSLAHPEAMRGGISKLEGKLFWQGTPTDFDLATLKGTLKLKVSNGQFAKLNPGAGKLLGLLSLQGLARRVTLDFKDVFSDGLAFDTIESKVQIDQGIAHTQRLQIDGPAVRVVMKGDVDLKKETQTLFVNVQPELGGAAALGVALINPVAGAVTWVAQKALQNPLNHIFSVNYLVTGMWSDPIVEKQGQSAFPDLNTAIPHLPQISPDTEDQPHESDSRP